MGPLYRYVCLGTAMAFFMTACSAWDVFAQPEDQSASKVMWYEAMLGEFSNDNEVTSFFLGNDCSSLQQFQLCRKIGMAFGISSSRVVETVFIYLEDTDSFTAYRGELPFGLNSSDNREIVEAKLKEQRVGTGTPNAISIPDHTHCWATYYAAGMTVIYNSPSADDKGATMHAILLKD